MKKFRKKKQQQKFETKIALFEYFRTRILKSYCHIWNQCLQICLIVKFRRKTKSLNLGLKMSYLGTFGLEFEKTNVTFEISTFEFV